ncbi:alpha/beta fold hydrolase [Luteococcus japonicus]|uniref:alpha/beta fold hydrolase n=1 Tax=Luteococcus japonicus TaxID=33984 RepID=UPI001B8678DC|nr:alpha/beta fold hydrolase [Luteococcus japonicus]
MHGGSGGVGSATIQLAKHLGATVATTASSRHADFVRSLGADQVIDYRSQDFVAELAEAPVGLVLDTQGGETTSRSFEVLRPGGLVVGIAGPPDPALADQAGAPLPVKLALGALSARLRAKAKKLGVRYRFLFIEPDGRALATIAGLVDEGVLRPVVDRILPFEQTLDVMQQMLDGGTPGKVLVATDLDGSSSTADEAGAQRPTRWASTPTLHVTVEGKKLHYRDLGPLGGTPVVLLTHLAATLDEWDPRVVDALAASHRVVALELEGVGGSEGEVPLSIAEMAATARAMIAGLRLGRIDLMGFSLGGFIAQQVALDDPQLVRRLVLTGTGPAGDKGIDHATGGAYIYLDMLRGTLARTDAKEFLFFPRTTTGKAAAKDYLARLQERLVDRDEPMSVRGFRRQIKAIRRWGQQEPQDLSAITAPTLIANGEHDRMVPTELSEDLHRRIPGSSLVIYPAAGHGGIFQHHEQFTQALLAHLD